MPTSKPATDRITLHDFESKLPGKYLNPCEAEAQQSYKCLDKNSYDRKKCQEYFDAYKACKKLWA
ncbi:Mitochondrial copper homeostasis protein, partial [Spiromyces aspiralis]